MNIMCRRITIAALALVFMCSTLAAAKSDPDKWLKPAKEAGFTYAVLTTRHLEGFTLSQPPAR